MSLSVAFVHDFQLEVEEYKEISTGGENVKKQEALQNSNNIEEFVERMQNNHLHQVFRKENGNNELMSYGCQLVNGMKLIVDVIFDKSSNSVNIQMTGPNETVLAYFNHSLAMVANL
jgi:predicted RNA-binding protein Jag